MAVATSKVNHVDAPLEVPAVEPRDSTDVPAVNAGTHAQAMLQILRGILAQQGLCESRTAEQPGLFIGVEARGEIFLQHNDIDDTGSPARADPLRRNEAGLLKCCYALAQHGYALTLIMSPRTLTLYVRSD